MPQVNRSCGGSSQQELDPASGCGLNNCPTVQPSGVITTDGAMTFTAANADLLTVAHQGNTGIEGNTATARYDWQVAARTGRFLDATVSGESIGITHSPDGLEDGTSEISLAGTPCPRRLEPR